MTQLLERPVSLAGAEHPVRAKTRPQARKFRPDIEGMRAFAVLSVILYHAGLGHIHGGFVGVDVFFVISGFLITRQLVSSVGRGGLRTLPTFYARRIRRLLPASVVVVVATVLVARFYAPPLQVRSIAVDGITTTFYGLNYRLAIAGTQYLHQEDAASPLQHFWSLGVEEQFYVFWPLLIVAIMFVGRRFRTGLLVIVLSAILLASFYYSVTVTRSNAPLAYFSLHTRAWELALGALVAVGAAHLARIPRALGEIAAVAGLGAVVASAFLFDGSTAYPGSAAALPVGGAAMLIAAGCGPRRRVERLLAEPFLQCVGRVSYSWYLWHWPMLILAPMVVGHVLNWPSRLFVVWLSLLAALVSYFLIEDPARRFNRPNLQWIGGGLLMSGAAIAVGMLVISHLPSMVGTGRAVTVVRAESASPAAIKAMHAALVGGLATQNAPRNLVPEPAHAGGDVPQASHTDCHADFLVITQGPCVYGDAKGTRTAVLFGDSHMEQYLPGFATIAAKRHWRIVNWTKSACPPAKITITVPALNRVYTECDTWRTLTLARIAALKPDAVIMSQSENNVARSVSPAKFAAATVSTLTTLKQTTTARITFIDDLPVPNFDMPGCVAQHLTRVSACVFPLSKAYTYPERHSAVGPAVRQAGVAEVDPRDWFCADGRCAAVVGNMLVYRDPTHMTTHYSNWLAPMVSPMLTAPATAPKKTTTAPRKTSTAPKKTTTAPKKTSTAPAKKKPANREGGTKATGR